MRRKPRSRGDIATLDWPALRDSVAACTACGLCESRTQTVFGVGHEQAHWLVLGEAPGEQEDRQGEPFVGAAGQLLDQMLRAVGQSRRASSGEGREDDQAGDPARRATATRSPTRWPAASPSSSARWRSCSPG